jgi:hypothetical protein
MIQVMRKKDYDHVAKADMKYAEIDKRKNILKENKISKDKKKKEI